MTKQEKKEEAIAKILEKAQEAQGVSKHIDEINKLKKQITELNDKSLRSMAETENIRKRSEKEIEDARKFALSDFIKDLINVVENLYRSTDHVTEEQKKNEEINKIFEGVQMTQSELIKVMEKYGVERIAPKIGDEFDHNFHQAISTLKDNKHPANTIINIIQAGYILKGRLIRPALVVVSSK
jgi:molecular chaperone GrpE